MTHNKSGITCNCGNGILQSVFVYANGKQVRLQGRGYCPYCTKLFNIKLEEVKI